MKIPTKSPFFLLCLLSLLLFWSTLAQSYPTTEKTPGTGIAPLDILSSQPSILFVPQFGDFKDRYLLGVNNSKLTIIDTTTWQAHPVQPDDFSSGIVGVDLLPNGTSLVLALSNGNLARIELNDEDTFVDTDTNEDSEDSSTPSDTSTTRSEPDDSREIFSSKNMTSPGASGMVASPSADKVFVINSGNQYYYEFNMATLGLIEASFNTTSTDTSTTTSTSFTPNDIVLAQSDAGDRIVISTTGSNILLTSPGSTSFTKTSLTDALGEDSTVTSHNLTNLTLSSDNNHVFALDETDDVVWVYSVQSAGFVDQLSSGSNLDPIFFDSTENASFSDIAIFSDSLTNTIYGYISGSKGLSVFDATSPGTAASNKNIDLDETTNAEDPIGLGSTPGLLATSSADDRYIYTANGDATISVITDKPFVSVTALSSTTVTEASSTFTVTFQTDTAGTYTVIANPDPDSTGGTELVANTTINDLNTDTTTATLDINSFDRSAFAEGSNRIVVFVTDGTGLTGRDGDYLTVDRPPGQITVNSTQFGNAKAYVTFTPSSDSDISSYTLYAEPAEDQLNPACPGSLTFASAGTVTASITPSECESSTECTGAVTGLTNDTTYCVAVSATDNSSQTGTLGAFTTPVTPELTVGPAAFFGEAGCILARGRLSNHTNENLFFYFFALGFLVFFRLLHSIPQAITCSKNRFRCRDFTLRRFIFSVTGIGTTCLSLFFPLQNSQAEPVRIQVHQTSESTPKLFTFETRGGVWLPTDSGSRDFFGLCCHPGGEFEFGVILKDRYNVTATTGFFYNSGTQVGVQSGLTSGDKYTLYTIPVRLDFIYRFDFLNEQVVVPYIRVGADSVIFVESAGSTLWGNKFGLHGGVGVAFLLDRIEGLSGSVESDMGINDMYVTLEGRYAHINSFKSTGLDLSGFYPFVGIMMAF